MERHKLRPTSASGAQMLVLCRKGAGMGGLLDVQQLSWRGVPGTWDTGDAKAARPWQDLGFKCFVPLQHRCRERGELQTFQYFAPIHHLSFVSMETILAVICFCLFMFSSCIPCVTRASLSLPSQTKKGTSDKRPS